MMVFLPLNLRIDNRSILFVGGGSLAMHKIRTVERFTRNITILAPEIDPEVHARGFSEILKPSEKKDLEGYFLVYAATGDHSLDLCIRDDARSLGILVNVIDNREESDFISPAVLKHDDMTIAVSSNGMNARKSVEWRNRIRDMVESWE
ncbi:MAG TPA: bifunctional precorrin-2 dehydrogenase/sirohydrochlorin ferrochelatase [Prosthecochloris aestuarii]|uniref:precorrin-2 dehydrogenase n=1 Tax=Prosthecochloris aestuarii TaxID=1102 RepID=A0A831SQQ0_PROAE|nr:bifunctional precorrin-2 dehydrogenase/sirohydrochlorin ferrochelatase [Prosthecochloris aestuarii]